MGGALVRQFTTTGRARRARALTATHPALTAIQLGRPNRHLARKWRQVGRPIR